MQWSAFGQEEECGRLHFICDFLDIIVPSLPTAFLWQNFLCENCPSVNLRKHLFPHLHLLSLPCAFR